MATVGVSADQTPVAEVQRGVSFNGGIGRGFSRRPLHCIADGLTIRKETPVIFFGVDGPTHPADALSRDFGVDTSGEVKGCAAAFM